MTNNTLFWICWGVEMLFMLWWLFDDLKLTYIKLNPFIPLGFLWLMGALLVRYVMNSPKMALTMVGITAVPLAIMGIFMLVIMLVSIFDGPIRWN